MDIKPMGNIEYSKRQFDSYKERLANGLITNGLCNLDIADNTEYKEFIANYVQKELADKDTRHMIEGITHKFAHSDINSKDGTKTYPIINVYKNHYLYQTIYFSKDNNNKINTTIIDVVPSKIILQ